MNTKNSDATSNELREQRALKLARYDEILEAGKQNRDLTAAEEAEIRTLESEVRSLNLKIQVVEADEGETARNAKRKAMGRVQGKNIFAKVARSLKTGHSDDPQIRALTSSGAAGIIQDPNILDDIIYDLLPNNPLEEAGTQFVRVENHTQYGKVVAYPSTQWVATEGTQVAIDSQLNIDSVKWDFHDLACLVVVQNQVLLDSGDRAERLIQESMRRAINNEVLRTVFAGSGASGEPAGLDNISGVLTHDLTGAADPAAFADYGDLIAAVKKLMAVNVSPENVAMFGNSVAWNQLTGLTATDNQPLMMPQAIANIPQFWTETIATDYGTDDDETRMYLGDFSQLVVGFQGAFEMRLVEKYSDYLRTGFLMHFRADIQCLREDNFLILDRIDSNA